MKRYLFILLLLISLLASAKIGGPSAIQGTISLIDVKDEVTTITISIKELSSAEITAKVKPGMTVRIMHSIETAQFRLPIG
ncbi:MAG: hypothetical protein N2445_07010, partial [Acidobacteria bacterium]|nr:hypothetical protein [Acidobacteriota bacterium]